VEGDERHDDDMRVERYIIPSILHRSLQAKMWRGTNKAKVDLPSNYLH
jgi:hypothetical protein